MSSSVHPVEHRLRVLGLASALVLWTFYAFVQVDAAGSGGPRVMVKDFPQFYVLGRLVVDGRRDDLQDGDALSRAVQDYVSADIDWQLVPMYGPQVAVLLAPLGMLPYSAAAALWLMASAILYAAICALVFRQCPALRPYAATAGLLAAGSPGLFQLAWYGQLSAVPLALLSLGLLALARGRPVLAGVAFGLLIYKPQYGLALAVVFVLGRAWRVVAGAALGAALELGVGLAYGGPGLMVRYIQTLISLPGRVELLQEQRHLLQSLLPLAELLVPHPAALLVYAAVATMVLVRVSRVMQGPAPETLAFALLLLATVLVSPHLYTYDLLILTPVFFWVGNWLLTAGRAARHRAAILWMLVVLYLWPVLGTVLTKLIVVNLGTVVMLALVVLVARDAIAKPQVQATAG